MPEYHNHIFLKGRKITIPHVPRPGGGGLPTPQFLVRKSHGDRLTSQLVNLQDSHNNDLAIKLKTLDGVYIKFQSHPGFELKMDSLESIKKGIRIQRSYFRTIEDGRKLHFVIVFVPNDSLGYFMDKLNQYLNDELLSSNGNPANKKLIESIESIKEAVLESFWAEETSIDDIFKDSNERIWCEAWIRTSIDGELFDSRDLSLRKFKELLPSLGIEFIEDEVLNFPERTVTLIKANRKQLTELISKTEYLAELRIASEPSNFWLDENNVEQAEWIDELKGRTIKADGILTSICVMDNGTNNGHVLLEDFLDSTDQHTYNLSWGTYDTSGHGTEMSGIALYGNLQNALGSFGSISINHKLESVKILPNKGANPKHLYGSIMLRGGSIVEIASPHINRIYCMAVTSKYQVFRGKPSSWSAAVDQFTSGQEDNFKRLMLISVGNIRDMGLLKSYPNSNLVTSIESPAQAWNALSIGAYTELDLVKNTVAPKEGLSPFSLTSMTWEKTKWPNKPDVVFEGGNAYDDGMGVWEHDDLSLLTTSHTPLSNQFSVINGTSSATAQASWFAANLWAKYPHTWAETIRGLIVHSAEYTETMKKQFKGAGATNYAEMLRIFGYGVPNITAALSNSLNGYTLIAEETLQPFELRKGKVAINEVDIYDLPWPSDELLHLGSEEVELKITLSYFIEPSPGETGWNNRYRYPSHTLRFELNNVSESLDRFKKRLSRDVDEKKDPYISKRWKIGPTARNLGSIHSDTWIGTAAELSTTRYIGISPVTGWWRTRKKHRKYNTKARYSLIVSLKTRTVDIDLQTPVLNKLNIPIKT